VTGKADAAGSGGGRGPGRPSFDLALLSNGDAPELLRQAEWRRLFDHFNPRLESYFALRVPDRDGLDDLVADVWRRILLNIGRLTSANALWSWMIQIGVNLLRDSGRQGIRRGGRQVSLDDLTPVELQELVMPRVADHTESSGSVHLLREALATLPGDDRELLDLYVIDELGHAEIAVRLNLPGPATSRKRLQRLKSHLIRRLRGASGEAHIHEGHAQEDGP